jgi:hypothetical protein
VLLDLLIDNQTYIRFGKPMCRSTVFKIFEEVGNKIHGFPNSPQKFWQALRDACSAKGESFFIDHGRTTIHGDRNYWVEFLPLEDCRAFWSKHMFEPTNGWPKDDQNKTPTVTEQAPAPQEQPPAPQERAPEPPAQTQPTVIEQAPEPPAQTQPTVIEQAPEPLKQAKAPTVQKKARNKTVKKGPATTGTRQLSLGYDEYSSDDGGGLGPYDLCGPIGDTDDEENAAPPTLERAQEDTGIDSEEEELIQKGFYVPPKRK